jgi:hypothetical protein
MRQNIVQTHDLDENGNPAGGETRATGILIDWQNGPLGSGKPLAEVRASDVPRGLTAEDVARKEPNGAFVEGVILAAIGRLQFYQTANNKKFACRENALAITKLEEALMWLEERTRGRVEREVEGTNTP